MTPLAVLTNESEVSMKTPRLVAAQQERLALMSSQWQSHPHFVIRGCRVCQCCWFKHPRQVKSDTRMYQAHTHAHTREVASLKVSMRELWKHCAQFLQHFIWKSNFFRLFPAVSMHTIFQSYVTFLPLLSLHFHLLHWTEADGLLMSSSAQRSQRIWRPAHVSWWLRFSVMHSSACSSSVSRFANHLRPRSSLTCRAWLNQRHFWYRWGLLRSVCFRLSTEQSSQNRTRLIWVFWLQWPW